jgi:hypothetical protein
MHCKPTDKQLSVGFFCALNTLSQIIASCDFSYRFVDLFFELSRRVVTEAVVSTLPATESFAGFERARRTGV